VANAFIRIELPERSADFQRVALEPGVPLLDRGQSTARLLRVWLGRFAAEPEWLDAQIIQFYVNDDQGRRIAATNVRPANSNDFAGSLRREVQSLRDKLALVQPRGRTEQAVLNLIRDRFEILIKQPEVAFADGALFRYQDSGRAWRLVWCWGYQRSESKAIQPVICANPSCNRLYLLRKIDETNCPKCHSPIPVFRFPWKKVGLVTTCLLLVAVIAGWGYWTTRPRSSIEGQVNWSGFQIPVEDAEIQIESLNRRARSDKQGRFRLDHLPAGKLELSIARDGFRTAMAHAEVLAAEQANIAVELIGDGTLDGRVIDSVSHHPLPDVKLRPKGASETLTTDKDGQFHRGGWRRGTVLVEIEAPGYPIAEREIMVEQSGSTPTDLELTGDAILIGQVISEAQELPMAEVVIRLEASGQTAQTDAEGWYAFKQAPVGKQEIVVEMEGFATERTEKELVSGQERHANFKLAGAAKISGTVIRALDQAPLADAQIKVEGFKSATKTDQEGKFQFRGITAGKKTIEVSAAGFQTETLEQDLSNTQETVLSIKLLGDAVIAGLVTDAVTHLPVPEVDVRLVGLPYQLRTDTEGRFRFDAVPNLPAKLDVRGGGYIAKTLDIRPASKAETSVPVILSGNSTLTGRVVERWSEAPVIRAAIRFPKSDVVINASEDGAFEIKGLRGGVKHQIQVEADGFVPQKEEITVQPGQAISKKIVMSGASSQAGIVVSVVDEAPVAGAKVLLVGTNHQVLSNDRGQFTLDHVQSGQIEFEVSAKGFETRRIVETVTPDSKPLTVLLGGNASIAGEVTDAVTGLPIANAELHLDKTVLKAKTDPVGAYQMMAAFPGSAKLTIQAQGYPSRSEQLELEPSHETRHDVTLTGTATIAGTIVDDTGKPVTNAVVQLEDTDYKVITGLRGDFQMPQLRGGPARLNISAAMFAKKTLAVDAKAGQVQSLGPLKIRSSLTLRGTVVHAETEKPVVKARLSILGLESKAETDNQGRFQLDALPPRLLNIRVEAPGFVTDQIAVNPSPDEEQELICLCPQPKEDEVFMVLSWRGGVKDLDGHLYRVADQKTDAHVFSGNLQADNLSLHKSNQNGHGPETLRIHPLKPGRYEFVVNVVPEEVPEKDPGLLQKYLSKSESVVKVYRHGQTEPSIYHVGRNKRAMVWQPFGLEIVGSDKIIDHVYKAEHYRLSLPPEISAK